VPAASCASRCGPLATARTRLLCTFGSAGSAERWSAPIEAQCRRAWRADGVRGGGGGGGVGATADARAQVGLLDIDICGPSVPKLVGLEGEEIHRSNAGWSPVYVEDNLAVMSIGFLLPNPDDAVIWRGPRKNGLIKQFLKARAAGGRPGVVRVGPGVGVAWRLARVGAWLAHQRSGPAGSRCPKLTMRRPARPAHQHPCSSSSSARPDVRGVVREERCGLRVLMAKAPCCMSCGLPVPPKCTF